MPVLGKEGFGLDSNTAVQTSNFAPDWCTMHVVQYQRNEIGVGADYQFDVLIYYANRTPIGQIQKQAIDHNTKTLNMNSNLPYVAVISATGGDGDADAVVFAYGGQNWGSNDQEYHSNFGPYGSDRVTLTLPVMYSAELVMDRFGNVHSRLSSIMKETHRIKEEEGKTERKLMTAHPLYICVCIYSFPLTNLVW